MAVVATRGLPRPSALAPKVGKLYGANTTFNWAHEGKEQSFAFILLDNSQQELFRSEVNGRTFSYPASAPALLPGQVYFWTVQPLGGVLSNEPSALVGFIMVSPNQRQEIEKQLAKFPGDSYDASLSRAHVFTDYRLWYDAIAAYTNLIARYPNRSDLYEQRGTIYWQLEVTKSLAEDDFACAEKVQHATKSPGH